MKKDYYFPHEIRTRNDEAVMELIECEGAAGYGIYWALLEYLRTQEGYLGKTIAVKSIARQMRTKPCKVDSVLRNYGLFVVSDKTFRSARLELVMKPLDNRRRTMEAKNGRTAGATGGQCCGTEAAVRRQCPGSEAAAGGQKSGNPLKTNGDFSENVSLIKKSKVKEKKEEDTSSSSLSSSSSAAVAAVAPWERYVDELQEDEQWKELMAMRTGLRRNFYPLFPRIVEHFKRHVRMLGNEGHILSPSDAKHYFFFFLNPSSPTCKNLILELQKPADKGRYRHEDRDPTTGQRSYCGVPIPPEAPPRPNGQAVWCGGKWVY